MKYSKSISTLTVIIVVFSLLACLVGIFSNEGSGEYEIQSFHGETVKIYGRGIYKNDSVSVVAQGIAQDIVTLLLGIPLLAVSLYLSLKGSLRGRLLLAGTLGYFLYTYVSYTFLWMYNSLFLIYVIIMSASFFAFTLTMMGFDIEKLGALFSKKLPVKFIGGFEIFFSVAIGMMWLGRIAPTITEGAIPFGLDHYTTLVIQGMDLGFILPAAIIAGILLIKRKPFGYLLSSVIIIKSITLATALTAMVIGQTLAGVQMGVGDIILFPLINLVMIYCMILILKNVKASNEPAPVGFRK